MRASASAAAGLLAATVAGLLLSACGSGAGAPGGWPTLEAGEVSVSYPKDAGWTRLKAGDLGKNTTAAVLERDGAEVARIAVRKRFMKGGTTGVAAAGAMASLQPGAKIRGGDQLKIDGRDAEKVEYTYRASSDSRDGGKRGIADGTLVRGIDVVALDTDGEPLLVRINAVEGVLTPAQLKRVVNSVTLGEAG